MVCMGLKNLHCRQGTWLCWSQSMGAYSCCIFCARSKGRFDAVPFRLWSITHSNVFELCFLPFNIIYSNSRGEENVSVVLPLILTADLFILCCSHWLQLQISLLVCNWDQQGERWEHRRETCGLPGIATVTWSAPTGHGQALHKIALVNQLCF